MKLVRLVATQTYLAFELERLLAAAVVCAVVVAYVVADDVVAADTADAAVVQLFAQ